LKLKIFAVQRDLGSPSAAALLGGERFASKNNAPLELSVDAYASSGLEEGARSRPLTPRWEAGVVTEEFLEESPGDNRSNLEIFAMPQA